MEYKDYYKLLGVERGASQDEIKSAYRKLARKYHPDVSKEANAETKFKDVQEAYEVLKDDEKRRAYDQFGSNWKHGQQFDPRDAGFGGMGGMGGGTADFSDLFADLFGGGMGGFGGMGGGSTRSRRRSSAVKGDDMSARITVTLEEVFNGGSKEVTLQLPQDIGMGQHSMAQKKVSVKIPKGIEEGKKIRLAGMGKPGFSGGSAGDLLLEVQYAKHKTYSVEGQDVYVNLPLAPWEAALGATVNVPTLKGNVDLKIPAGSKGGSKMRLKGRGLPGGDQFVVLQIVTPAVTNMRVETLYKELQDETKFDARENFY